MTVRSLELPSRALPRRMALTVLSALAPPGPDGRPAPAEGSQPDANPFAEMGVSDVDFNALLSGLMDPNATSQTEIVDDRPAKRARG